MKPSGIGGQAVIEGVMMKNKDQYAVAVRKPNKEIVIETKTFTSAAERIKIFKLPIFRGMLAFVESMIVGTRTLTFSASFFEEEEEVKPTKVDKAFSKVFKEKAESVIMGITFLVAILLAVGIFIVLPAFASGLLRKHITSDALIAVIEGCIRIAIFVAYIAAISQMKDIKRMFMYHGAEHKTINCLEQGFELTVENVRWQSKQHKRCGTSFMFIVMFISIIFFIFIRVDQEWLRYLIRVLLIPIIAGVSYEFIRFAGKSESRLVNILSQPGMWLQGLTTKEPDDEMIEVAISSVDAVFDWKGFLEGDTDYKNKKSKSKTSNNGSKDKNKAQSNKNNHNNTNNKKQADKKQTSKNETSPQYNSVVKDKKAIQNNKADSRAVPDGTGKKQETEVTASDKIGGGIKKNNTRNKSNKKNNNSSYQKAEEQEIKKAAEETAATKQKKDLSADSLFGEEEDEILRALDRYLDSSKENNNKE